MDRLHLCVNGRTTSLAGATPCVSLLDWLRAQGLTGAKEGCAEGECGACAVLVARPEQDRTAWVAVNACLPPALAYVGQEIVTAEGLGSPGALHPVQAGLALRGGSQCGYCTPGFVCSMAAEYYRHDRTVTGRAETAEHGSNGFDLQALSGNLCRCTGYRPIRDAAFALGEPPDDDPLAARLLARAPQAVPTQVRHGSAEFARPATLAKAVEILARDPEAVPVAGATDLGVVANASTHRPSTLLAIDQLPELRVLTVTEESVEIGAALSLSEVERDLHGRVPLLDALFPQFASRLVRNVATIGGNLGTASPIGDCAPVLLALDASVVLASVGAERVVPLTDYFTGNRRTVRRPDELITAVRMPAPRRARVAFHKIAKRRFDDISSVAVALSLEIDAGTVTQARIGLGGVAATPLRAVAVESFLAGRPWTLATVQGAAQLLADEGTPMSDHRASGRYRRAMLGNALLAFYADHSDDPAGG